MCLRAHYLVCQFSSSPAMLAVIDKASECVCNVINGSGILSAAITRIPLIHCQFFYDFLKAYKNIFQMVSSKIIFKK